MLPILIALSIFALVPVIFLWPHVGIFAWFWVSLMNPHRLSWGSLDNLQYAAVVAGATLLAFMISRERKRIPVQPVTVLLVVFTVWIFFTTLMAHVPNQAWLNFEQAFKIILMTLVTMALINTRERLHALVWIMVICLGFYGFKGGVFTILSGGQYHVFGPPKSFIADNNQLALALIMILPFIVYLYQISEHVVARAGLVAVGLGCAFSIIGSQSRGAFLALAMMALFLVAKSRHRLRLGVVLVCFALTAVWFVPESWVERMESIQNYEEDESAQGRFYAWEFAYKVAVQRPLTGGGFNVYRDKEYFLTLVPEAETNKSFHSVYFEVLGEHGFLGLGIFLSLMLAAWLIFGQVIRQTRGRPELRWAHDLGRMGQVSLVGYAAAGAFLNLAFYDLFYLVIAIGVIAADLVARTATVPGSVAAQRYTPGGRFRRSASPNPLPRARP